MVQAYLGLGANLGDRVASIYRALALLASPQCTLIQTSGFYESEPWGVVDQPRYINAACKVETGLGPHELLNRTKAVETTLGRVQGVRFGPRPIDLDILIYGALRIDTPRLEIPHPMMLQRAFVLMPLSEIAPGLRHPTSGRTISQHLSDLLAGQSGPPRDIARFPPGLDPSVERSHAIAP